MSLPLQFANPHALWLLAAVPFYLWICRRRRTSITVRYPSIHNLKRLPRSLRQRLGFLPGLLRTLAIILLIVVLARPTRRLESQEMPSQGIGIAIVLDRSASMGDPNGKLKYEGRLELRFDVAKAVLKDFIEGGKKGLAGRPNDLIGLFTFATYPRTDHPFSLDQQSLVNVAQGLGPEKFFLDTYGEPTNDIQKAARQTDAYGRTIPRMNPMQLTDLKAAIEYATNKLVVQEEDLKRAAEGRRRYDLKSKVLLMLTDGEPTAAEDRLGANYADDETIRKLTDAGIKVYFVQILSQERYRERPDGTVEIVVPQQGLFVSPQAQQMAAQANQAIDEARKLARKTGGEHFLATSGDQIREIYARIDSLERSDIGGRTVFSHEECYQGYLYAALALLGLQTVLGLTWLRRVP